MTDQDIKQQVRKFYDQVGWQVEADGLFQNAHYEDLRPVSAEYIHRCHGRVGRHLKSSGKFLLDAGSGPVQYEEYMDYLRGYQFRVCADISIVALMEARKKLGDKGLYVVSDIANLPFKTEVFDGVMSMHTIHHLPREDHRVAYQELYRVLSPDSTAVVVNGWTDSALTGWLERVVKTINRTRRKLGKSAGTVKKDKRADQVREKGTFVQKYNAAWLKSELSGVVPIEILVWRSASVRFLRTFIHQGLGGKQLLRWLFALEEKYPRFFGENGQYPLIVIKKP
jgi:ubiquinone/menaquinone biosynthesis C-methylase UbiE